MTDTPLHFLRSATAGAVERGLPRDPDSPEALMDAVLQGDARAFERLFRTLAPRVASALAQMTRDSRLAEDLTQAVFMKLYRARGSYQRGMLVTPWIFAIARNTFLDHTRQVRRRPETLTHDGRLPELPWHDDAVHDDAERVALYESVEALPEGQRQALLLMKVHGLSLAEVAALCGTSPASIKMRVHRAYQTLRSTLSKGHGRDV